MNTLKPSVTCNSCGESNSSNAKFCQRCGVEMPIAKCKRCGISNKFSAIYCIKCGVKLSEAKLGITDERAQEWWNILTGYTFFSSMWSKGGLGDQIHKQCLNLSQIQYPNIKTGKTAFIIPITPKDWFIESLEWKEYTTNLGEILCSTSDLVIYDLLYKKVRKIPYKGVEYTDFDGWIMLIGLRDNSVIKLHIKLPSHKAEKISMALSILGGLLDATSKSPADTEAIDSSVRRSSDDIARDLDNGREFWESISKYFSEVLSHQ